MSIESAKAFMERVVNDKDFRKEVGEIATAEERMAFVTAAGFDFTKEELKNVQEKMQLTDEELGSLAGGGTGMSAPGDLGCYDVVFKAETGFSGGDLTGK